MFGKKDVKTVNPHDEKMRKLRTKLADIRWEMDENIRHAYITSQAVAVYFEGSADWKIAIADRGEAQKNLLSSIGSYDSVRAEILRYLDENGNKMSESWATPITSHEWVEMRLERFLWKN